MSLFGIPSVAQPDQLLTGRVREQAFFWVWLMDGDATIYAVLIYSKELLMVSKVTATLTTLESLLLVKKNKAKEKKMSTCKALEAQVFLMKLRT